MSTSLAPSQGMFAPIPSAIHQGLLDEVSHEEVHTTLFSMKPWKAPGWDGLQGSFFQSQ